MQLSILLLATDRRFANSVVATLTKAGHSVLPVTTAQEFVGQAAQHAVLVIDGLPAGATAASVLADVRATPATAGIPVLCIAQSDDIEERIQFLEAGADDVLRKPFDPRELEALVEALARRVAHARGTSTALAPIGGTHRRRVVVVYSPKGGVGTTTIAANLAVLAAERQPDDTALIDLDLQFGQVATHLNLTVQESLLELSRDGAALQDAALFRTYATPHRSGVQVFAAPPGPGFASLFTAAQVDAIIDRASQAYQTVIIDAGSNLDEITLTAIARAETLVVPVIPEIPSLTAVHALLDNLNEQGSMSGRTLFVLNHIFARKLLRLSNIEQALGVKIAADLPYDSLLYLKAVNEGVPLVSGAGRSAPSEQFRKLAITVLGREEVLVSSTDATAVAEKKGRGLGGILTRN